MLLPMPRLARVVVPGVPHHITQRGVRSLPVFFSDADRRTYLALLAEQGDQHGVAFRAYCLMTNHVHLVAIPIVRGTQYLSLAGCSVAPLGLGVLSVG